MLWSDNDGAILPSKKTHADVAAACYLNLNNLQRYTGKPHSLESALPKFMLYTVTGSSLKVTYILSYKVFICQMK